jgi:restriction endonuclease S subunit
MIKVIVCLIIGFFIGVILTTIMLCQKNLEQYQQIKLKAEEQAESAKNTYKNQMSEANENNEEDDNFEKNIEIINGILEHLHSDEDDSNYKKAVLGVFDVLQQYCTDTEDTNEEK